MQRTFSIKWNTAFCPRCDPARSCWRTDYFTLIARGVVRRSAHQSRLHERALRDGLCGRT